MDIRSTNCPQLGFSSYNVTTLLLVAVTVSHWRFVHSTFNRKKRYLVFCITRTRHKPNKEVTLDRILEPRSTTYVLLHIGRC